MIDEAMRWYFGLQFRLLGRKIREFGLNPTVAYILGTIGFYGLSIYLFYRTTFAVYIYVLIFLGCLVNFRNYNKDQFLQNTFNNRRYLAIRITENGILALPFLLFLLLKSEFMAASILILFTGVMTLWTSKRSLFRSLPTPFSDYPFEFAVGFRKTFILLLGIYALLVVALLVDNSNLGLFTLAVLPFICMAYYTEPEPLYYVWIFSVDPVSFVKKKVWIALMYLSLLMAPSALTLLIVYPQHVQLILVIYLLGLLYLTLIILVKYTAFPNVINIPQGFLTALALVFPPLLLFWIPWYYLKSTQNLKSYLR